jgi:predicted RNase H-like HicB family nuclease
VNSARLLNYKGNIMSQTSANRSTKTSKSISTRHKKPRDKTARRKYVFPVIIEKDGDGFFAVCPSLQGCYTQGETYEEVVRNIEEAVQLHVESRLARDEVVPHHEIYRIATVEVKA